MTSRFTTPLGRYRITVETSETIRLSADDVPTELDAMAEVLHRLWTTAVATPVGSGMPRDKRAAMVAKMKATRKERGIEYPRGDAHWKRRYQRGEYVPRSQRR